MMEYPVFFNIENRLCVVVGGGPVGWWKAEGLAEAGARVRLIAGCAKSVERKPLKIEALWREYLPDDLRGAFLVFAATNDRAVNAAVTEEAKRLNIPVNVADSPEEGDFILPARFRRGDLTVAVSTNGKSPAFAVLVEQYLEERLGSEWVVFLEIATAIRRKMLTGKLKSAALKEIYLRLLDRNLPGLIIRGDTQGINAALTEVLGHGCSLDDLDVFPFYD